MGKSCFEACAQIAEIHFENDSKLVRICRSALRNCKSLSSISIPASVEIIEEASLEGCDGLESCILAENANLVRIEAEAFSECFALRSFCVPRSIKIIGENCFRKCHSLRRLMFSSGEFMSNMVGNSGLDEVLETLGLGEISSLLKIGIEGDELQVEFGVWSSVAHGSSYLTLVHGTR